GSFAVPWPVMRVTGVAIDDEDHGDDDGVLDPGERAFLDVELANVGGLASFGGVSCTLTRAGGDVGATVLASTASFGLLASGAREREDDFEIQVSGGAADDDLDLLLTCTDQSGEYLAPFDVELGQPPWIAINAFGDPAGDAIHGYDFDIVGGR